MTQYTIVHSEEKPVNIDATATSNALTVGPVKAVDWSMYDRLKMAIAMR